MIRSLRDKWRDDESPNAADERVQDLTTGADDSQQAVAERTPTSLSPVHDEPAVRRDLLAPFRRAPRLRMLVLTYVAAVDQAAELLKVLEALQRAGAKPTRKFWQELQGDFGGMGLRPKLPPEASREFRIVDEFDDRYRRVAIAAGAALNPNQSAASALEALEHVTVMRFLALDLATTCKGDAETLMDELNAAVSAIFGAERRTDGVDEADKTIARPALDPNSPQRTHDANGRPLWDKLGRPKGDT